MNKNESALIERMVTLERRFRQAIGVACAAVVCTVFAVANRAGAEKELPAEIRTTRLVVVDDQGKPRIIIGQDPKGTDRISRAAGIVLLDDKGDERGGFSTLDDGSVVLGMDSPAGVGSAMRDRIGLKVYSNGAASISLLNNQAGIPVRMISEASGDGGLEFLDYDLKARKAFIKRMSFAGETKTEQSLGGG